MKATRRLLSELNGAVSGAWAKPLTAKEAIAYASAIGSALVCVNQWGTHVQMSSHSAGVKASIGSLRNDMGSNFRELKKDSEVNVIILKKESEANVTIMKNESEARDIKMEALNTKMEAMNTKTEASLKVMSKDMEVMRKDMEVMGKDMEVMRKAGEGTKAAVDEVLKRLPPNR